VSEEIEVSAGLQVQAREVLLEEGRYERRLLEEQAAWRGLEHRVARLTEVVDSAVFDPP